MTSTTPLIKLNNGLDMPILGFGVFQMTDLQECERKRQRQSDRREQRDDSLAFLRDEEIHKQ